MPSPFPGMDPYIEACELWEDFHDKLIGEIERTLSDLVPDRYSVRLGERSYVVFTVREGEREHRSQADVAVTQAPGRDLLPGTGAATAVLDAVDTEQVPVTMRALVETEYRESFVEIREFHPEWKLVTTIEVLSPSNKRKDSPGWFQYNRKRQAHLEGNANLVEIDLLRGGTRMPMEDEWPRSPYYLLMSRRQEAPWCSVWPAHFVRPLPVVPVPLAPPDPDVPLNLQPMIDAIYRRSRYDRDIDYRQPCHPPLSEAESSWMSQRLRGLESK